MEDLPKNGEYHPLPPLPILLSPLISPLLQYLQANWAQEGIGQIGAVMLGHHDLSFCNELSQTETVVKWLFGEDWRNGRRVIRVLVVFFHDFSHGDVVEHDVFPDL
jgi:hypothetical protein